MDDGGEALNARHGHKHSWRLPMSCEYACIAVSVYELRNSLHSMKFHCAARHEASLQLRVSPPCRFRTVLRTTAVRTLLYGTGSKKSFNNSLKALHILTKRGNARVVRPGYAELLAGLAMSIRDFCTLMGLRSRSP